MQSLDWHLSSHEANAKIKAFNGGVVLGYYSYLLGPQKRVLKQLLCSKLGIKWLKWDEYTIK